MQQASVQSMLGLSTEDAQLSSFLDGQYFWELWAVSEGVSGQLADEAREVVDEFIRGRGFFLLLFPFFHHSDWEYRGWGRQQSGICRDRTFFLQE